MVLIEVDGQSMEVPEGTSIKEALEALGFQIIVFPSDPGLFMPCQTEGCWSCTLDNDGELGPACVSTMQHGMRMKTDVNTHASGGRLQAWPVVKPHHSCFCPPPLGRRS